MRFVLRIELTDKGVNQRWNDVTQTKQERPESVQFSLVQDGICALGKTHTRSTPCLRSLPNVAFETALGP